ncbi:Nitrogenase iron protein [Bienertia sinuspersici]
MEVREYVNEVVQNLNEVHITTDEQINHGSTRETHFIITTETSRDATTWNKSTRTWKRLNKRNSGEHYECGNIMGSKRPIDEDITHVLAKKAALDEGFNTYANQVAGLANPDTIRYLRELCWRDRPNIVFLMEMMIDDKKLDVVKKKCGFSNGICLSSIGRSGGMGNFFTWKRGVSPSTIIRERLDRFLTTPSWCSIFHEAMVINLPIQNSDHGPKFESYWLSDENCEKVIKESWVKNGHCTTPVRISRVLKNLPGWVKDTFGDIKKRLKQVEKRLISL